MRDVYEHQKENNRIYLEEELGIKKWALNKSEAMRVLQLRLKAQVPCKAGDVLVRQSDRFTYTFNNCSTDKKGREGKHTYAARSIEIALNFIDKYKDEKGKEYYFVIY